MTPREYQQKLAIRQAQRRERLHERMARVNKEARERLAALRRQRTVRHDWTRAPYLGYRFSHGVEKIVQWYGRAA